MAKPNAPKLSLKSKGFREQNSSTFSISRNRGLSDVLDRRQRRQTSSFGEDDLRGLHVPRERPQPDVRLALADRAGGRYECSYKGCGRRYPSSQHLHRHRSSHYHKLLYQCKSPNCDSSFSTKAQCVRHQSGHAPTTKNQDDANIFGRSKHSIERSLESSHLPHLDSNSHTPYLKTVGDYPSDTMDEDLILLGFRQTPKLSITPLTPQSIHSHRGGEDVFWSQKAPTRQFDPAAKPPSIPPSFYPDMSPRGVDFNVPRQMPPPPANANDQAETSRAPSPNLRPRVEEDSLMNGKMSYGLATLFGDSTLQQTVIDNPIQLTGRESKKPINYTISEDHTTAHKERFKSQFMALSGYHTARAGHLTDSYHP
ncbi:hypothetical protein HBI56_122510 [Parastagonospora nodorum]|uniref:C2H2-type domain-containing protein n=1 Tax=Phaeosphaeria nodorum (strain SN15 / ATCC MYA-4574 / FGSC 10173) TaxID=321614 RepID=A0A7U2FBF9_PHANO|nr:hypothetical protein HBH56_052170 [Parastagonospora nodorum]QRD02157.1 hypothetical protein JI435_051360 [Parastagonospora nodorum SN15]KAH3935340.1 hypothetical protein HBH54_037970 [Parastagonospora nodorum]KAH3948723.1 hypothetical protein HBH53_101200 [Parastagonospora nodorum]KAH3988601.1 hypothetical protein HBH52_026680 [Parastagonospora nodorum]